MSKSREFRVYPDRITLTFFLFLSLVFVVLPFALHYYYGGPDQDWSDKQVLFFLMCVSTPFFGTCGILCFVHLVKIGPILILDRDGVQLRTLNPVWVAWSEVADVCEVSHRHGSFLVIELKNPEEVFGRTRFYFRILAELNAAIGGGSPALNISGFLLNESVEDIIREARKHLPRP